MKKQSVSAVLESILTELEAGRQPGVELVKRGRSALRGVAKSLKAATAASVASGKSGRKRKYDREAIKAYIRENPDGPVADVIDKFGCSAALVSLMTAEVRNGK